MAQRVKFGFGIDFRNPVHWPRPWPDMYQEFLEFSSWVESLGYEYLWIPEHHGVEEDGYPPSPFVLAAAIAARTRSIRIASGVALAPFYHPVRLAEDCAVIDIISNGRLEVCLGIGYVPAETAAYGIDFKTRARRTDEILQIVKKLWQGEEVSWKSDFFDLTKARVFPRPIQQPNIPLLVGGVTAPGFRRAALHGDGYAGPLQYYPAYLEALEAAGKDPAQAHFSMIDAAHTGTYVAEDPDKAFAEIAPHVFYNLDTYARWQEGTSWGVPKMDMAELKRSGMLKVLTPDEAILFFKKLFAEAPIESFQMKMPTGMPFAKFAPYAELFAKKVMPAFR